MNDLCDWCKRDRLTHFVGWVGHVFQEVKPVPWRGMYSHAPIELATTAPREVGPC